jgi:hypothetical protein
MADACKKPYFISRPRRSKEDMHFQDVLKSSLLP